VLDPLAPPGPLPPAGCVVALDPPNVSNSVDVCVGSAVVVVDVGAAEDVAGVEAAAVVVDAGAAEDVAGVEAAAVVVDAGAAEDVAGVGEAAVVAGARVFTGEIGASAGTGTVAAVPVAPVVNMISLC
jgi:hypothetical protein